MTDERILAIDIGAGTMDTLLYDPAQPMENAVQLVLPSATSIAGARIAHARDAGRPVYLHGNLMGGFHTTNAVWRHLEAGLAVYATERAARTVHDDLDLLRSRGIVVTDSPPPDAVPVELRDVDLPRLAAALAPYDVTLPPTVAIAAQDHGFSPKASNRLFRFEHWRRFLTPGSTLAAHVWRTPPEYLTRLAAIQADVPGAVVADNRAGRGPGGARGSPCRRRRAHRYLHRERREPAHPRPPRARRGAVRRHGAPHRIDDHREAVPARGPAHRRQRHPRRGLSTTTATAPSSSTATARCHRSAP